MIIWLVRRALKCNGCSKENPLKRVEQPQSIIIEINQLL